MEIVRSEVRLDFSRVCVAFSGGRSIKTLLAPLLFMPGVVRAGERERAGVSMAEGVMGGGMAADPAAAALGASCLGHKHKQTSKQASKSESESESESDSVVVVS